MGLLINSSFNTSRSRCVSVPWTVPKWASVDGRDLFLPISAESISAQGCHLTWLVGTLTIISVIPSGERRHSHWPLRDHIDVWFQSSLFFHLTDIPISMFVGNYIVLGNILGFDTEIFTPTRLSRSDLLPPNAFALNNRCWRFLALINVVSQSLHFKIIIII
jgi:hypothetical protein